MEILDDDREARNVGVGRVRVIALRIRRQTRRHGKAVAFFLAAGTMLAGGAKAQSGHDQYLAWCTGEDIGRKIAGCSALIESGKETPETLAIAYLNRGNALDDNGQIDIAIQDYDQAIKNNPQSAEAFFRRGAALEQKGEFDRAIADLDTAIKLDPNNAKAFADRGHAYSHKKDFEHAIEDYTQSIKLAPNVGHTFSLRAYAYEQKAQYDLAIADCEQSLKLDSDDALAYYVRGLSKQKKGDKSGGKADIAKAKQFDPNVDRE